jgi:hypothetical protein
MTLMTTMYTAAIAFAAILVFFLLLLLICEQVAQDVRKNTTMELKGQAFEVTFPAKAQPKLDICNGGTTAPPQALGAYAGDVVRSVISGPVLSMTGMGPAKFRIGKIIVDLQTGEVTAAPGATLSKEARNFWDEIEKGYPGSVSSHVKP